MLGSVTPLGTPAAAPAASAVVPADAIWQELPRRDPVAAQKAVSEALSAFMAVDNPDVGQLQALLALDRKAQTLVDALLVNYLAGDTRATNLEKTYWQAAFELCRSFGRAHGHFLRSVRDRQHYRRWRAYLPSMLARLFQHRQVELLLRPYVNEPSTGFSWREVHEAYEYAQSCGLSLQPLPVTRCRAEQPAETTLQREYVHVLVQDLMNQGHFSPYEAFWVSQGIPRWCAALPLLPDQARAGEDRFVIDLGSDEGVVRTSLDSAGARIRLDTAPALALLGDEIVALRDAPRSPEDGPASGRGRQLKLLRKVNGLVTPKPPMIARRGDRKRVAQAVEIVIGLAQVIGALRRGPSAASGAAPPLVPESQQPASTAFGGLTGNRTLGPGGDGNTDSPLSSADLDAASPLWRLVDRSDSGCRLQGQIFDTNWVLPGTLIALREGAAAPWMLAIVRRVERQADNRADIGVEYVGRNPRGVKITVCGASGECRPGSPGDEQASFAALYLPESATQPVLPVKTLVLPARQYAPGDRLTLRSVTTLFAIQLKEPIEEQGDFVWLPFDIVARTARSDLAADRMENAA